MSQRPTPRTVATRTTRTMIVDILLIAGSRMGADRNMVEDDATGMLNLPNGSNQFMP